MCQQLSAELSLINNKENVANNNSEREAGDGAPDDNSGARSQSAELMASAQNANANNATSTQVQMHFT